MSIPRVEITWIDSCTYGDGWVAGVGSARPAPCTTVGFLLRETKSYIVIAHTVAPEHVMGALTIPKVAITKRRRLKWK